MAVSYIVKVKSAQGLGVAEGSRSDFNFVKYWVDTYNYVTYRGEVNVLHLSIGNSDIFVNDPDRFNWEVIKIDDTIQGTVLKRADYPYFRMDKYIFESSSAPLKSNPTFIENEFINYKIAVLIEDETPYNVLNVATPSNGNAALKVMGGGFFGKNVFIREALTVGDYYGITERKYLEVDSSVASPLDKALVTIYNPGASATLANGAISQKGALHVDGGVSVTGDIVANNIKLVNGLSLETISSKFYVLDSTLAIRENVSLGIEEDASITTAGGVRIKKNLIVDGVIDGTVINSEHVGNLPLGTTSNSVAYINNSGVLKAPILHATSHSSTKQSIVEFTKSALDIINKLKIHSFQYKSNPTSDRVGIIADWEPNRLVSTGLEQDMSNCINLLIKAVQELSCQVKTLQELS